MPNSFHKRTSTSGAEPIVHRSAPISEGEMGRESPTSGNRRSCAIWRIHAGLSPARKEFHIVIVASEVRSESFLAVANA